MKKTIFYLIALGFLIFGFQAKAAMVFDGCGKPEKYIKASWAVELQKNKKIDLNSFTEICYAPKEKIAILLKAGTNGSVEKNYTDFNVGEVWKYSKGKLTKANFTANGVYYLAPFVEFGKRVGNNIELKQVALGNDTCSDYIYDYSYNWQSNKIILKKVCYFCQGKTSNCMNITSDLCKNKPQPTATGLNIYPIADNYRNIQVLGQVFTGANCGQKRLNEIMKSSLVSGGLGLYLKKQPSADLLKILKSLKFVCSQNETMDEKQCQQWESTELKMKVNDLLKFKKYYKEIESDDCVNCG
jgi:hypothetical protein